MMKWFMRLMKTPVAPAFFYFSFSQPLDAYLDPGTGSIILQAVIGVAVGGLFAIGIFWQRTKTFVKNLFSRGEKPKKDDE